MTEFKLAGPAGSPLDGCGFPCELAGRAPVPPTCPMRVCETVSPRCLRQLDPWPEGMGYSRTVVTETGVVVDCGATPRSLLAGAFCAEAETSNPASARVAAISKAAHILFMACSSFLFDSKIELRALVNIKHPVRPVQSWSEPQPLLGRTCAFSTR